MTTIEELARYCTDNDEWQVECPGHCEDEKSPKTDKIHNLGKIIFHPKITKKAFQETKTVDGMWKIHSVHNMNRRNYRGKDVYVLL